MKKNRINKNCIYCSKSFEIKISKQHRKFCSKECFYTYRHLMNSKTIKCLICNEKFLSTNSNLKRGNGKYCSRKCFFKSMTNNSKNHWFGANHSGKNSPWYGGKHSKKTKEKMRLAKLGTISNNLGKKASIETRIKQRNAKQGSLSRFWKDGRSPLVKLIRGSFQYREWRDKVFKQDNYTCQKCFKKGIYLEAHHKKEFFKLFESFLQQYSQFSPIEDKETLMRLAITYDPFWDLENGETLCINCHNITKIYNKVNKYDPITS